MTAGTAGTTPAVDVTEDPAPGRCPRCFLRLPSACVCAIAPRLRARTDVLILRHVRELRRPSNTGRLVALALERARVVTYGTPGAPGAALDDALRELLRAPGTTLLWPEPAGAPDSDGAAPRRLVVLDATWPQARKMLQRVEALRRLPRLSLDAAAAAAACAAPRLRRAPRPGALSTIEAVARALEAIEGPAVARPLDALFAEVVRRSAAGHERG